MPARAIRDQLPFSCGEVEASCSRTPESLNHVSGTALDTIRDNKMGSVTVFASSIVPLHHVVLVRQVGRIHDKRSGQYSVQQPLELCICIHMSQKASS
jgi:hypothetical protein